LSPEAIVAQAAQVSAWLQICDTVERADLAIEEERRQTSDWYDKVAALGYSAAPNNTFTHPSHGAVELADMEQLCGERPRRFFIVVLLQNGSTEPVRVLNLGVHRKDDGQAADHTEEIFSWVSTPPDLQHQGEATVPRGEPYPPLTTRSWRLEDHPATFETEAAARFYRERCSLIFTFMDGADRTWERVGGRLTQRDTLGALGTELAAERQIRSMIYQKPPQQVPGWRREALRTNLWLVATVLVALTGALFAFTYAVDRAAASGTLHLPNWVTTGGSDAARQVLAGIAAAVLTIAVVFSIAILVLQLASQQIGPWMPRNFIRDRGTQATLSVFVSVFVFSILAVGSVGTEAGYGFVPHLTIAVALALTLVDLGLLIYFIHHVVTSIQLASVVSGIANDFAATSDRLRQEAAALDYGQPAAGPLVEELQRRLDQEGDCVAATRTGFLQAVGHDRLVRIASSSGAVIRLLYRPGHFVVKGLPMALVWPPGTTTAVTRALERAHVIGPHRTPTQDVGFAIDQLVGIALRALSPVVNDTFTALICIDWLGAALCQVSARPLPDGIYRDASGHVRLIDPVVTYERLVKDAYDKLRQAGRGMPAVLIRQLDNLEKVMRCASSTDQRSVVLHHADMILLVSEQSVPDASDQLDVQVAHRRVLAARALSPLEPDGG
jgi:uncharacterized membrane protein